MRLSVPPLALLGLAALSPVPVDAETIRACVKLGTGNIRIVSASATCSASEAPLSWSRSASLSCPAGTTLSIGVCIENTGRTPATQPVAAQDCADDGRRLPTAGELLAFRDLPGITLAGTGEWADDAVDLTGGVFTYLVVSDIATGYDGAGFANAYRCVAGAAVE